MRESSFTSREALIESSLNEFTTYNYEKASLNRIIKNAGISKGTFYYHFKNKEDLYKHLLKTSVRDKWAFINNYTKEHKTDFETMDIFDKFLYQAKSGTKYALEHPEFNQLGEMFSKEKGTPIYTTIINEVGGDSTDMLKTMVHDAYHSGEIDQSYSEDFVYQVLETMFNNFNEMFKEELDMEKRFKNLEEYVRFMKNGLCSNN